MIEKIKELLNEVGGRVEFKPSIKIRYTPHSLPILIKAAWVAEDGSVRLFIIEKLIEKHNYILTPEHSNYFSSLLSRIYQQLDNKHETN